MEESQKYYSVLLGPYSSGKDSFLFSLDEKTLESLNIQREGTSTTKNCEWIGYSNDQLKQEGFILNTIGFGNPDFCTDYEIAFQIVKECLYNIKNIKHINYFFFVQPFGEPFFIEKIFKYMKILFGESVFESSIVIGSKGNLMDEDDLENRKIELEELAARYKIKGGVFEMKGYIGKKKNENNVFGKNIANDFTILIKQIENLPVYSLDKLKKINEDDSKKEEKKTFLSGLTAAIFKKKPNLSEYNDDEKYENLKEKIKNLLLTLKKRASKDENLEIIDHLSPLE